CHIRPRTSDYDQRNIRCCNLDGHATRDSTAHCDIAGASVAGAHIPREVRVASVLPVHCCSRSPLWLHAIASWRRQSGDYSHPSHRLLHGARQQKAPTLRTSLLEVVVRTTFSQTFFVMA